MSSRTFLMAVFLLSYGLSTPAWSRDKTDIITLYNGDRLTGELQSMYGGIVSLNTDALGTAKIEWKRIARIESVYHYDIRLSSGERHFAAIGTSDITGQLKIIFEGDEHNFEMLEVAELRPIENSILDRVDLYLSAGYSYTKASSVAQTSFNTEVNYEDENTRNTFTGRTTITDTTDEVTSSSKVDLSRQVWTDRSKSYRTFYGRYESNDELALEGRYTLGGGMGRYFIDTQKTRWVGSLGLQVITESQTEGTGEQCDVDGEPAGCVDTGDRRESIEGVFSTTFAAWRFDTPELDLDLKFNLYPSLTEKGRVRADTDIRLRWELIDDLYFDLTTFVTYDKKAGIDNEVDYGITTGIGWTY